MPPSAQQAALAELHADKFLAADNFKRRTVDGFDYLGFEGSFEISWGLERLYHPEVVLRKRHSDPNWSGAAVLQCDDLDRAFRLPDKKFVRALSPWRR